jgi:hypothetical protein
MAKGQVTPDDLASGMKAFGGLSSLGGGPRPVRDNPFRDTRSEPPQSVVVVPAPETTTEAPRLEVVNGHDTAEVGEGTNKPTASKPPRERKPVAPRAGEQIAAPVPAAVPEQSPAGREKKTELYPEQVSLMLNAEIRDRAEALAKELQRRRTQKTERITTNAVIRVAIRAMLEVFDLPEGAVLNTENELYQAVLSQWSLK